MNNTFNINRFGLLLRRQVQEYGKIYAITIAVLIGALSFCYWYYGPSSTDVNTHKLEMSYRIGLFMGFGLMFVALSASTYFAAFGNKSRTIAELMLPSSKFEKFLAGILLAGIIPIITFLAMFLALDVAMVGYLQGKLESADALIPTIYTLVKPGKYEGFFITMIVLVPLFLNSLYLLGSIYFEKYHFLKTTISVIIISLIVGWLLGNTTDVLFEGKRRMMGASQLKEETMMYIACITSLIVTTFIWFIGYIRLKEKEV